MLPAVRFVRRAVLGSVLVAVLVSVVLAGRSPSSPQSLSALFGGGVDATRWGPLTASDRDMLITVRQADLWEGPASDQAARRASRPEIREVGRRLAREHAQLDADLRAVADELGMPLPGRPGDTQRGWLAEIVAAPPGELDHRYVNLVRSAHGEAMPLIEGVRAGTGNQLVRAFAVRAAEVLGRHMSYLESTGEVDYALLPPSTAPAARLAALGGYDVPVTLVLFGIGVLVAAGVLRGLSRSRPGLAGPGGRGGDRGRRPAGTVNETVGGRPSRRAAGRRADRPRRTGTAETGRPVQVTTAELIDMLGSGEIPVHPGSTERATSARPGPATGRRPPVDLGRCTERHPW